ncbi:amidohydrolase family protein [Sphingomonas sp. BIUV-7]|uniref:Amidohydrolase family protein n=1 Tax=Sphingomonas natans TaxID=3063330 RepID=A0ABT8Y8D4_9SPHN|nr:amidohydrolase family protein [Sphingomonas sp. BIUV-7]MDO6414587.1 amidohydrolase family protein [Sphingomonas sp. BIUV-7]
MIADPPVLIRNASFRDGRIADVRIDAGRIATIGALDPRGGETLIDARGGALLPGLHDHHLHLAATAVARSSVGCGPPEVATARDLAARLGEPGDGWLRGVGYDEGVAGPIDRDWLDRVAPDRPVRIQHRSGRMWVFNSAGLARLLAGGEPPSDRLDRTTARLFDDDAWLRRALGGQPPALDAIAADYAARGVTGLTEMSPSNGRDAHHWVSEEQRAGRLAQRVVLAGTRALADLDYNPFLALGPVKIHLHEADLPDHADLIADIVAAHAQQRGVAVHCVTEVELVYTIAALEEAGVHPADRIEHASVTPDSLLGRIAALKTAVVSQPLFIHARGDRYRRDIDCALWPELYRLRAFVDAGIALAGSSDAPYGPTDPWAAMATAVSRRTREGAVLGGEEALSPEQALSLYLADPLDLTRTRFVTVGGDADLCLLATSWQEARADLSDVRVRATLIAGRLVHDRVDEPPAQRRRGADALA